MTQILNYNLAKLNVNKKTFYLCSENKTEETNGTMAENTNTERQRKDS